MPRMAGSRFPPRIAGASLKPLHDIAVRAGRGGFPPRIAGASLKHDLAAYALSTRRDFPRVLRGPH